MAEAFTDKGCSSYKYQYSVLPAVHGSDVTGYFGPLTPYQGPDFLRAFMSKLCLPIRVVDVPDPPLAIWGNFITQDNPSISAPIANGNVSNPNAPNPIADWPAFAIYAPYQINLNQSGGIQYEFQASTDPLIPTVNTTIYIGPGLTNNFSLVNAYTWEAGRGYRCDFWRSVAAIVPE